MRDNCGIAIALCKFDGAEGFSERANLINLYEDRVGAAFVDTALEVLDVGYKEVVADELATVADEVGKNFPALPVVLVHAVFDGVDGEFLHERLEEFGLLLAGKLGCALALFPGVVVNAVMIEL